MAKKISDEYISQLSELLYDPDPTVEAFFIKKASLLSEHDILRLKDTASRQTSSPMIRKRLGNVIREKAIDSFIRETRDDYPDVARSLSLLDRIYLTDIDSKDYGSKYLRILDSFLPEFLSSGKTLVEQAELFNLIFFKKFSFRIVTKPKDIHDYLVYTLLDEGRGDIIALATLYTTLALACGLEVCPVPAPQGGFRLYYMEDSIPMFFVDLQQQGDICPDRQPLFRHNDKDIIRFYFMSIFSSDMRARYRISPATIIRAGVHLF